MLSCNNEGSCLLNGFCECQGCYTGPTCSSPIDSKILNCSEISKFRNNKTIPLPINLKTDWKLLYRATVNGFMARNFHDKCDGHSPTLTFIQTTLDYVFGGYTAVTWNSTDNFKYDKSAFIFSLVNKEISDPIMNIDYPELGINADYRFGPSFGLEIVIFDSSNTNNNSRVGLEHFQVREIEVFKTTVNIPNALNKVK